MDKVTRYHIDKMPFHKGEASNIYLRKNVRPYGFLHLHDCYEMEIIVSGEVDEIINAQTFHAKPGDAILVTPNDFHELRYTGNLTIYNVMFREEIIGKKNIDILSAREFGNNFACTLPKIEYEYILKSLEYCEYEYNNHQKHSDIVLGNAINSIITLILRNCNYQKLDIGHSFDIRKALVYMQIHYRENPDLKEVAEYVGFDPAYFSVKFSKVVGITFKQYLNELKLNCARQLLLMTESSVSEVSELSGFDSISYFHRKFYEKFGKTPLQFRKDNIK